MLSHDRSGTFTLLYSASQEKADVPQFIEKGKTGKAKEQVVMETGAQLP